MTKNKIEAFAGDEIIFLKGQNLVNRHRVSVKPTASGANTYLANVFDNDEVKLEVSFTLSNDEVRAYACPCPAQAVCPHVIAALIELHTEPEISAKEELLAVTGVKKPKTPKANKPRADVTYTDPGWKKVTLHFECLKTIDHEGKIVGQFQAIFENEKRERFCPLAEPNIFVVRANQITQLRMINANHTAIVIDAQFLPPAELEIFRFLLNNQPDFSYTKNTDLRRSPKNTFWLSAQSVVKLVNYLKDKYQLKNNEAVRTFLETNAPAYALITRAFPRRVLYRKIRQDRYQVDLQFYVRKRWRSMIEFRHDQDGRMLLLDPEIRIWRNKQNFNVVSFSETSLPESYFFYRFEPPAQTDGIIDFKYLDDQRERDLFSLIPKAKITLEYHHARELFNHKIKYVYPGRSGFTVAAADDDPKTNVKRLWIYEKALLSALTDNDQKPRKVLFKNKKINDLKVRDLRAMRGEYAAFRQSEMATYKVVPCLTTELFITFSYEQFQSIALVNDKLAIVCRNLTLSVKEVCRMVDAYLAKKEVYIGADGYYDLTRKEAQQFCQFWAKFDFYRAENPKPGTFLFPKFRVLDLLAAFGGKLELVKQYAHPAVTEMISALKDLRFKPIAVPKPLQGVLRPYQVEGYRWLKTLVNYGFGGVLADDMGLGKTIQAIALLYDDHAGGGKMPSLVIAPATLVANWKAEFTRFAPRIPVHIIQGQPHERAQIIKNNKGAVEITSIATFRRDLALHRAKQYRFVIVDEAQAIKNHATNLAAGVKTLSAQRRFALTGTPLVNNILELWSIFDFVLPGLFGSLREFAADYEKGMVKAEHSELAERLKQKINTFILRRTKEKVLTDLPPKTQGDWLVQLSSEHRKFYERWYEQSRNSLRTLLKNNGDKNKGNVNSLRFSILSLITELRQICCSPTIKDPTFVGRNTKLEACLELIAQAVAAKRKVLVFTQFLGMIDIFKQELDAKKIPYFVLTGEVKKQQRTQIIDRFNRDQTPVFLATLQTGGVGLNIMGAEVVIHYDLWWNEAAQNQATDRVHRIGQTKPVNVYRLIVEDSIEERVLQIQENKAQIVKDVIQNNENVLTNVPLEDLISLFNLLIEPHEEQ